MRSKTKGAAPPMTTILEKPEVRPRNPLFSSGPCTKRPGWTPEVLAHALIGRSHRGKEGKARLKSALDRTRSLLGLPSDYRLAIVPASDTGAFEMAMWSLLGARGIDVLVWESFGQGWATDVVKQLKLADVRVMTAEYGKLPDLARVDFARDVIFTWNGTTSGVRLPNADWIPHDRQGLTLVDATSAIFAQPIDWAKTDVVTYSWQKVLGGEAAHGMLILSPRAVERLESYVPPWPLPKIFRMTKGGALDQAIFEGETINTPSMLCVEDYLDCLSWAERVGGLHGLNERADANARVVYDWIERTPWIDNLAVDRATWSNTSVCLKIVDPEVTALAGKAQAAFAKDMVDSLEREKVAYDIGSYRDAPPGLRIWTGSTVETDDLRTLMPWLDWAFATAKGKLGAVRGVPGS
jgi:phosphoserine aminotransferase